MERFFSLSHLTAEQLRSLYLDAVKVGKLLIEYDRPREEGHYDITLPEDMILDNIAAGDDNCFVFHENHEDFPDAVMVGFPLKNHPYTTAYIDIDNVWLPVFAEKYGLAEWWQEEDGQRKYYPFSRFYTLEPMKHRRNIN